ncbi:hypothetical protein [Sphingobium sp. Cam5-1]|uniref:hypothetical protein n=1 Tax=Sphingobium sp. Cam5-1 TaxID=2789327 RepID=UPI0018AD1849|nr:hypothetical protein [Sphingobium sp. Cam5-1]QPI72212.1 hypothetical protein IZV00_09925 [Sphingobium sp. Cam5-1]
MYSTLDGAKKCAKQLKRLLQASAMIFPLSECQNAVALAGGYRSWHDLNARIGQRQGAATPYDYWGNLIKALPQPCHRPVSAFLDQKAKGSLTPSDLWVRDVLPYAVSLEIVLRANASLLRPGSGPGQRLRLAIVSGMLLNVEGGSGFTPKLDPKRLGLTFEGTPASILPKLAHDPKFDVALRALVDADILMVEKDMTMIQIAESSELRAEILSRASQWGQPQTPPVDYEQMDDDLAAALAHQEGIEWRDAGPKVPYDELEYRGILLQSRYSVAREFQTTKAVVDAMTDDVRLRVSTIWCDSKASAVYSVTVTLGMDRRGLADDICDCFRAAASGFNGISVEHGDDQQFFDPEWPGDEQLELLA